MVTISNSALEAAGQNLQDNGRIGMENEDECGQRKEGMAEKYSPRQGAENSSDLTVQVSTDDF